jgi:hypothetical protein
MSAATRGFFFVLAAVALALATAGCPDSDTGRPPVATTKPIAPEQIDATAPTPAELTTQPDNGDHVEVRIVALSDPQRGWLRIESIRDSAMGAWGTGDFLAEQNKIVIDTENVDQFTINLSKLRLNWNRRVILRIDGHSSELTPKRRPILRLRRSPAGGWKVVE